jgi:acyl-coenzyme A synthetase/AMP-(fatty) acid ligase
MLSGKNTLKKYDLSSIRVLFTGAAPLGKETSEELLKLYPNWRIGQGYGRSAAQPQEPQHLTNTTRPHRVINRGLLDKRA